MALTINLDDDFIPADELKLMQTKQAILEKLRRRFGDHQNNNEWVPPPMPHGEALPGKRASPTTCG